MTYAWFMVGITFLTQFVAMGITFYSATFFLVPLQQEFDTGATEVSLIGTAMSIGVAIVSPFVGRWVARGSIRNIMTLGCLAMGIGFLVGSRATDIWYLIALFATFVTFAMATMGGVTTQALVVNWFEKDRAMALGISLMGVSASGFVLPPITSALVEAGGWRWAYEVFGWACLCVTPIVYFSVVGRPEERSANAPDASAPVARPMDPPAHSTREALRERNLWVISITCGLSFMVTSAIMLHIVPHAMKSGIDSSQGAHIIQAIAAGAMLAKVAFGWLARRIGELHALQVALAMQGLGTFGLNFAGDIASMIGLACVLGTGLGGVMPLAAALLARAFGPAAFGPMMGLMTPIMIPFQAIGQPIAGAVVDFSGSYRTAWFGFTVVVLAAMAILAALRLPDDAPSEPVPGAGHEGGPDSSVT